jgi:hypothetical protein
MDIGFLRRVTNASLLPQTFDYCAMLLEEGASFHLHRRASALGEQLLRLLEESNILSPTAKKTAKCRSDAAS